MKRGLFVAGAGATGGALAWWASSRPGGSLARDCLPSSIPAGLQSFAGFSGVAVWDVVGEGWIEGLRSVSAVPGSLLEENPLPEGTPVLLDPVVCGLDFAAVDSHVVAAQSVGEAAQAASRVIEAFVIRLGLDQATLVVTLPPGRKHAFSLADMSLDELDLVACHSVSSGVVYTYAAILAGVDVIDFTPSESLVNAGLRQLAEQRGVQLVGRDGSTGQTMLKGAIADMFARRGLRVESWYSSNHLGNRDGLALVSEGFSEIKLADKLEGLSRTLGAQVDHVVSIDYVKSKLDRKESFDSVVAVDAFGRELRLRVNWEAWDSALALPMLIDLLDLVARGRELGLSGYQPQLGFFFKRPLGVDPIYTPGQAHAAMLEFYLK